MKKLITSLKQKRFIKATNSAADICGQLSYNFIDDKGNTVAVWDLRGKPRRPEEIPKVYGGGPVGVGTTYIEASEGGASYMYDGEEYQPL